MPGGIWPVDIGGQTQNRSENHTASVRFVTPGFFQTLQIPLVRGRDVRVDDKMGKPLVAVVSESFARRYWPGQDPIGRQFRIGFAERQVAGVVRDIKVRGLERKSEPQVYLPHNQVPDGGLTWYAPKDLVISAGVDSSQLVPALRQIIRRSDEEQPVTDIQLLSEIVENTTATRQLQVRLLTAYAGLALLLAAIGLYGLIAYTVSQRTQEFGVRKALGAQATHILALVLRQSLTLSAFGLLLGAVLAAMSASRLQSLLYGVGATDGATWLAAIVLCLAVTLLGGLKPAVRAARIDALEAIRRE
jgi:predicted permease